METSTLRAGEANRQARREERCGDIGRTAQRSGRPPAPNPLGPGAFAARVRRRGSTVVPATLLALLLPAPQNPLVAGGPVVEESTLESASVHRDEPSSP